MCGGLFAGQIGLLARGKGTGRILAEDWGDWLTPMLCCLCNEGEAKVHLAYPVDDPPSMTHADISGAGIQPCRNRLDPSHNEQNYASIMRQTVC